MNRTRCPDDQTLMLAAADRLDPQARPALDAHFDTCPHCRRELADLRTLRAALPASDWECPPDQAARFASRVTRSLRRPVAARRAWQAVFASAVLAVVALLWLPTGHRPPSSTALPKEIVLLADQGLLENLDLLEQLDLLETLEDAG